MLNYLWSFMILAGVLWGMVSGSLDAVTQGLVDSAKDAVTLGLTMLGIMSFWSGILEVGNRAGVLDWLSEKMKPVLHFLFPELSEGHPALKPIAVNMAANMLGLGMAATPAGLEAMKRLKEDGDGTKGWEEQQDGQPAADTGISGRMVNGSGTGGRPADTGISGWMVNGTGTGGRPADTATNSMCTFLILNISSLQLVPITMVAYRTQYGSANPMAVLGPALAATACSTLAAVVFCKIADGFGRNRL